MNNSVIDVRNVMMKLDKERKEMVMKMMNENQRKLEREEADRFEAQKKQEELRRRKRKTIVDSPTQSPLPSSPDSTPEKMKSPEKAKLKPPPSNHTNTSSAGNANAPPVSMITFFVFLHSFPWLQFTCLYTCVFRL